jgi:hypothetical protein
MAGQMMSISNGLFAAMQYQEVRDWKVKSDEERHYVWIDCRQ